nr:Cna B-type domain-containing protein [Paucisalibacillus sp. EB02]
MKEWKDESESDRPDNITVELYRTVDENEELVETKTINSTDNWKHTFTNLTVYDEGGNAYEYHVKEKDIDKKYMLEGIVRDGNTFTITNVRTGETKVEVEKEWLDEGESSRPEEGIVVELYRSDDTENPLKSATIKADTDWKYTFDNLAAFDNDGKAYTYTVKEQEVVGYKVKDIVETDNGYKIINVRTGETKVAVEKEWKDNEDATGDRPDEIIVELYQNNIHLTELDASIKADEEDNWKYTFENLPEFDAEGKAYTYTVKEEDVKGYISSIEAIDEGFKITNLRTDTIDVVGKKTWIEVDEQYRPDFITVNLLANGEPIEKSLEVTANDEWEYEFTGLDRFDSEGKEITYTIEEENIVGYKSSVDGYNITNTQESIEISGSKTWKDNENATGDRPESIIVQVMKGDTVVKEQEVTAENKWEYTFTDLAKYDKDGNEITYKINELPVPGYSTTIDGFDIVNTRTDKVDVEGTKSWKDDESADRPTEITVQLLANGIEVDTTVVTEATDWKYEFKDLDAYDNDGIAIDYKVTEDVEGYKAIINGYDITNVRVGTTSVEGTKTWKDGDSADRPEEIVVKLLQNDEEIDTVEVSAATDWKYSFTNLDKYDENGVAYKYTIEEVPVDGYETSIEGFDITNLRVGKKDIKGTKTWLDDNSKDRPESITVYLLVNGEKTGETAEVTVDSDWKYAFTDLDKYDNQGEEIVYSVDEEAVDGYETIINGYDITNLRIGTTEIEVTKLWIDEQEMERPETIKVNILQNGDFYAEYEVTKENDWKRTITDLPKYDEAGKAYEYTVKEHDVAGYASEVDGFKITNTRADMKSIEITKTWLDDNSEERPSSIEVELFRSITNGEKELVDTYTVTADADWVLEIEDLPVFNENGKAYTYEIKEQVVAGYESSVNGFDITNLRIGTTSVEGVKTWKDDNSKDRPEMIKINLLQNGVVVHAKEVTAEMDWKYSFTNLDKYDENGVAYEYTIKEEAVEGYKTIIDGYDITNVRVGTTAVEGTKTWKDDNSIHRPDSIVVELLQNGNKIQEVVVTASQDWKYSFKNLPEYDENGVAYKYTVKEQKVAGYHSTVEGFNIINTLIPVTPENEEPGENIPDAEGDQNAPEKEVSGPTDTGSKLPDTATNMFNVIALGLGLLIAGFTILLVYRRKGKA